MSNNKRYILFMTILSIIVLSIPYSSLDVVDLKTKEIYISKPFLSKCTFEVGWIHSVEITPWAEYFEVINGDIFLYKTRFKSFGAGVPDSIGTKSEIIDGYVEYSGINKLMPNLVYGISKEAKHVLTITTFNSTYFALHEFLEPDTAIKFEVVKSSLLFRLLKEYL